MSATLTLVNTQTGEIIMSADKVETGITVELQICYDDNGEVETFDSFYIPK